MIHEYLLGKVSQIKGSDDYKKRLIVAEIKDKGSKAWWAIIARARALTQDERDPKETILTVVTRYKLSKDNPVDAILIDYGPWTTETIPFLPSLRQAVVILKKSKPKKVEEIKAKNISHQIKIDRLMDYYELRTDPRTTIYKSLKIIPNWEIEALRLEFGLSEGGKSHWRPTIKFAQQQVLDRIMKDRDLIRVMTDPNFSRYNNKKHLKDRLNDYEVRALESFQKTIRKASYGGKN